MPKQTFAAIDLGSNSFRLEMGQKSGRQLRELISLREPVRLAAGLTRSGMLDRAAQTRGLDALARFRAVLRHLPKRNILAVGTNTLRVAKNAQDFLACAEEALGLPIQIISGDEEAKLIYLGVCQDPLIDSNKKKLVVDIGGGSTELIVGVQQKIHILKSLPMGCVVFSRKYFSGGHLREKNFDHAQQAALDILAPHRKNYKKQGWQQVFGTSGTVNAISKIGYMNHHDKPFDISRSSLVWLRDNFLSAGKIKKVHIPALSVDRCEVLPGGLAILMAIFESLDLQHMGSSKKALRHGLLHILATAPERNGYNKMKRGESAAFYELYNFLNLKR